MKYIDAEKLLSFLRDIEDVHPYVCENLYDNAYYNCLQDVKYFISSHLKEQSDKNETVEVAEKFARIVRGNLIGIDEKVQQRFEQLYFEVTGNKMYGGYND